MGDLVPLRRIEGGAAELSSEALVSATAAGDAVALGTLFDRHHQDVYRFLARIASRHADDLDDLVQATFLEVHRSAAQFTRRSSAKVWIFGIAVNVARHHARSEQRRRAAIERLAQAPSAAPVRPDAATERAEMWRRLSEALLALPEPLRVAYVLCVIEEVPAKEAAGALGSSEGTIWRRVHEARQALGAALEGRS